jgi:hypothetical protein
MHQTLPTSLVTLEVTLVARPLLTPVAQSCQVQIWHVHEQNMCSISNITSHRNHLAMLVLTRSAEWDNPLTCKRISGTRWGWVVSVTPRPPFTTGERTPGTHCTGVWVGPRAGLDTEARGKIFSPLPGIEPRTPGRPASSQTLYWLSYLGSLFVCVCVCVRFRFLKKLIYI